MLASNPTDAIRQLTGIFNATTGITQWVGTLVNSVLPQMNPTPDWYQSINSALYASQQHSQSWLNETAPDIIADMSNAFINYSSTFANAAQDLSTLLDAVMDNEPTPAQLTDIIAIISLLEQETSNNRITVATLLSEMSDYQAQMQADSVALKTALASALPQEAADLALVQQVQTQIQAIEITLAADSSTATADSLDTTSSMIAVVTTLTFALGFEPVGFGIALLFVGVDAVIQASAEAQVISDLEQIETLSAQLSADEIQLGLMQGIVSNLQSLENGITTAMTTFDDFDDTWEFANYGLNYLLVVLAQPQIDISKIPDLNDLGDAVEAWQQMAAFASKVLNATIVQQPPIVISTSQSKAA